MEKALPIAVIVISNIFYHICSKETPEGINPYAALTVTYLVGAAVCAVLFLFTRKGGILQEYKQLSWSNWVLGIAIVGLEAGSIAMYKAGWAISSGQLVHSAILAVCLIVIGVIVYKEHMSISKIAGIVMCLAGLYFINK